MESELRTGIIADIRDRLGLYPTEEECLIIAAAILVRCREVAKEAIDGVPPMVREVFKVEAKKAVDEALR